MTNSLKAYFSFFWAGLRKQGQTGGLVPSQRFLIAMMIAPVPKTYRGQILELGAGTGALTVQLATRCPQANILACEINPTLARNTMETLRRAGCIDRVEVVSTPAEDLLSGMDRLGMEKPGFIISGIPLGNMGGRRACALLDNIHLHLAEGGLYIQFQHSLLDRKHIRARFAKTRIVPVFLNFPPAVVYYAPREG
ncbi:MAG: methyltransferase domain-containing protein [Verrucomicrobia bacterium]|jgi:phospholipid N-methyltransferase|nr:methyltransferase domain-containing protein [Verrucomicrobiota bacterium]